MMQSAFFLPKRPAPDAKPNLPPCLMSAPICAALRVLRWGNLVRKISSEDFAKFETLLGEFIVKVYANRLGEYSDEKVMVGKAQAKKKNVIVDSRIEFANGRDPIDIDWWLRLEKDGSLTLFDVRVLGVWMAQEQRDAFASVLKNNKGDINALLEHLRKQIKADAES